MKIIIIYLAFLISGLMCETVFAQTDSIPTREYIEQQKNKIIEAEKEILRQKVEAINQRLDRKEITVEEADRLKKEAADVHAQNIKNKIAIFENEMELRRRAYEESQEEVIWDEDHDDVSMSDNEYDRYKKRQRDKSRTYKDLVIAAGFNNALQSGQSINDSDFKFAGSRFFEIGMAWNTRVFSESDFLRVKYGFSFQFNGLKPTDNRIYVEDGDLTVFEEFPFELDKAKFRTDNLVFPVHLQFAPAGKLIIGLGGFAGFNIGERQKLKYEEEGEKVKRKLKNDYNTNDFVYGLSGYLSLGGTALYAKYDLSPIFQDPNVELNNMSIGLRFDL